MHNFRELKIWQRSIDFVTAVYELVKQFPQDERYGLVSQLKRSSVSIPSNISEGAGRSTNAQFRHFLEIAMGSCNEVVTQLELACRLKVVTEEQRKTAVDGAFQIYKMILGFYKKLE